MKQIFLLVKLLLRIVINTNTERGGKGKEEEKKRGGKRGKEEKRGREEGKEET